MPLKLTLGTLVVGLMVVILGALTTTKRAALGHPVSPLAVCRSKTCRGTGQVAASSRAETSGYVRRAV